MDKNIINWKYLIDKYGEAEAPHKFESIALEYVKDVYPQYSWYPTARTRDGNKDAQRKEVFFGEDDSFDVWEEAKYKSADRSLRRQDIDPTILSGLIQGNVRLIVFVSNAPIPDKLIDRAVIGARIKGIRVSCVLAAQLESWLVTHPKIYREYWNQSFQTRQKNLRIISIQNAVFYDMISNDFHSFNTRQLMYTGETYLLTVTVSSSITTDGKLLTTEDFPFDLVEHTSYDDPQHLSVEQGLSTFALLLKAKAPYSGAVNLSFQIGGETYSRVTQEIELVENPQVYVAYAQQFEANYRIKSYIEQLPAGASGSLITVLAGSGMGKSFLLKDIYKTFGLTRDMTIVDFESDINALTNYLLLCRIVLFLCYGNIFWGRDIWPDEERERQKDFAIRTNNKALFDDVSLGRLFDGAFDAGIAKDVIEDLTRKRGKHRAVVHTGANFCGKILLLDDFQYLNKAQQDFIYQIFDDLTSYHSSIIIIVSATAGRFPDNNAEKRFVDLSPNAFILQGLTYDDMAQTLSACLHLPPPTVRRTAVKILSPSPLLSCELIRLLRAEAEKVTVDPVQMISTYSTHVNQVVILENRFIDLKKQYYLLDIIYRFKKGLPVSNITAFDGFDADQVLGDLRILASRNLITLRDGVSFPYHDSYVRSYIQLRGKRYNNILTGRFLRHLLSLPNQEILFDTDQLLSMLIACGKQFERTYSRKTKELIRHYMNTSQFGAALHYCSYYYRELEGREPEAYTAEDFRYLFYYAYCLVHCGDHALADQLLETIYTFAGEGVPEKYSAASELLSQSFWAMRLDGFVERSYLIQGDAEHMLRTKRLSGVGLDRVEQAYDTCFNRRMVAYLLMDEWEYGRKTYAERLKLLVGEYHGDAFRSHAATLIMDYARGISYVAPHQAEHLLKTALSFFSCDVKTHHRRLILCKIDLLLMESVNGDSSAFREMTPLIEKLMCGGFSSEYFKAVLKRCACRAVYLSQKMNNSVMKAPFFQKDSSVDEEMEEITNALTESGLRPANRDEFLLNNLWAYYSIRRGDKKTAIDCLEKAILYVSQAGQSYRKIAEHNLRYIDTISRIAWCTIHTSFSRDCFLLDCRFW